VLVRRARAGAALLLVHREEQTDLCDAFAAQSLRRRQLRSDDALRVARAAPVDVFVVFARSDVRRHCVHVRREHDARARARCRQYVRAFAFNRLQLDCVARAFQMRREEARQRALVPAQRRDVDQSAREGE
jgi:hypothetical protein